MDWTIDPMHLSIISGAVIPILTGVITKLGSSTTVKAVTALALSVVVGALSQIVTLDGVVDVESVAEAAGMAFLANLSMYLGAFKPIGKTEQVPLQLVTENFGIGRVEEPPTEELLDAA